MRHIRSIVSGAIMAGSLALAASFVVAEPTRLTYEDARKTAWLALADGRPDIALELAEKLLARTPDSYEIAVLRYEALRLQKRDKAALTAARAAWKNASTSAQQFEASQRVARLHYDAGRKMRAQFWLRRASQAAPSNAARVAAVNDFRFVRATSPLTTRLHFSIFPSSNINNGSTNDTIVINGLPFQVPITGQPHSGTGITLGATTTWRKKLSDREILRVSGYATGTTYRLSSSARALGSGKTGSDFSYGALELTTGLTWLPADRKGPIGSTDLALTFGRSWYGGDPLANTLRLDFSQNFNLSRTDRLSLRLGAERQRRLDDDRSSATILSSDADWSRDFKDGAQMGFGLGLRETSSTSNIVNSTSAAVRLSYRVPRGPWDLQPTFSLTARTTEYDRLSVGGVMRRDDKLSASVSMLFPKLSYYGFAPTLSLSASRNRSTLDIYSTRDLRMSLGVRSTF